MSQIARERAAKAFTAHFGNPPNGVAFAPGRVNLIGDHVDYNGGLVMPLPLAQGTAVAWSPGSNQIEAIAADAQNQTDCFTPGSIPDPDGSWRSYLRGMAAILPEFGLPVPAIRLAIAGDLPRGAGLSSSASLEIALGRAFSAAAGLADPDPVWLAQAGQLTEHRYAGVKCGIMDQVVSAAGVSGHVMLLDCRDLSFVNVPLPADWAILVIQSNVTRGLVDGEYNARRQQCEEAAASPAVGPLRDAGRTAIEAADLDPVVRRRALHVVDEIARTQAAAAALRSGDLTGFGALLNASHSSLRDLFEVSHLQVDTLVGQLQSLIGTDGGARMTGGGFGGAVVAVMHASRAEVIAEQLRRLRELDGLPCEMVRAWTGD